MIAPRRIDRLLTLSMVPTGQQVRVMDVGADQKTSHRLHDMGIVRGVPVTIVQDAGGSLLVAVGDTRLGLACGLAHRVRVLIKAEEQA